MLMDVSSIFMLVLSALMVVSTVFMLVFHNLAYPVQICLLSVKPTFSAHYSILMGWHLYLRQTAQMSLEIPKTSESPLQGKHLDFQLRQHIVT